MMILPKDAFMVLQDAVVVKEKTAIPSIIISMEEIDKKPEKPNTGVIVFTGENVTKYQLCKVKFRANYADPEEIEVDGKSYLYFRDFESSIFYVTKD